jgi:hypothetical protein
MTFAQDMSTITCQIHEMVMGKQILPFRQQGIMPVASKAFNRFLSKFIFNSPGKKLASKLFN